MKDISVVEIIRQHAKSEFADQVAFQSPQDRLTYRQTDLEANRVAQGLLQIGIGKGDRIGCLTKHMVDCLLLQFGANKIGAVNMPFNWRLSAEELQYVIDLSEIRLLLADEEILPVLDNVCMPNVEIVLVSGPTIQDASFRDWRKEFDPVDPGHSGSFEETALQLASSGTTGRPKIIEVTYGNLLVQCRLGAMIGALEAKPWELSNSMVFLNLLPTFHVSGVVNAIATFYRAGKSLFYPTFEAESALDIIEAEGVTDTWLVPTMLMSLADAAEHRPDAVKSLKRVGYGGSPMTETLLRRVITTLQCGLTQAYGMTEASGTIVSSLPSDHDPDKKVELLLSVGRAIKGVELRIVDPATFTDLVEGEIGEIWVRSKHNMKGYFKDPEATREVFPQGRDEKGGWYRTGDMGCCVQGYVYLHDRLRDMVISGGENIYPAEVENALSAYPAVADVAVIGVPDNKWGEAVKAFIVLKPDMEATEADIIDYARDKIAHYKCPKSVNFIDMLPRNPSGKILKWVLREGLQNGSIS